jgi:hypothetical protein
MNAYRLEPIDPAARALPPQKTGATTAYQMDTRR